MSGDSTGRLIFEVEWLDTIAEMVKNFYLFFFPADNTIELFDIKNRKVFLRRTRCETVNLKDLYIGAVVTIFSRPMKITDVADAATKQKINTAMQKTFALFKRDVLDKLGEILKIIAANNLHVANMKMCELTEHDVKKIHIKEEAQASKNDLTSAPVVIMTLLGDKAINCWQDLIGSNENVPMSLTKLIGKDSLVNSFYGSLNEEIAEQELGYFFPGPKSPKRKLKNTAILRDCTCCIIKPHAVQARLAGNIIDDIQKSGYIISAIQQFQLDPVNAEEFLEVYKGVVSDYAAMVAELQSGPCLAMEITHKNKSIVVPVEFRKMCGPTDPEIGRQVRPNTLRAKYGKSKVQNAIHCSDLPEDGLLEVEYFFKILDD